MSVFVLVHGAWHGSWCWKRVRRLLRSRGAEVFTPTLTGIGERSHLLAPHVDLETHINDVANAGEGWKVPPIPAEAFNVNLNDVEWVNRQRTMQPLATFQQRIRLTGAINSIRNITFILANGWSPSPFPRFYEIASARGWNTLTINCGHDVRLDEPEELAAQLQAGSQRTAASAA
jgi:hypothetical protein